MRGDGKVACHGVRLIIIVTGIIYFSMIKKISRIFSKGLFRTIYFIKIKKFLLKVL